MATSRQQLHFCEASVARPICRLCVRISQAGIPMKRFNIRFCELVIIGLQLCQGPFFVTLLHDWRHCRFYARPRQHICYSAYMLWQFRLSLCPSVRPSFTRVDQSKTVEARITQFSPYSSPITLVFRGWVSSRNSNGSPEWGLKGGWGRQNERISSFKHQNLNNGARYDQSYYWSLIGSL